MKPTAVNTGLIMGSASLFITLLCYLMGPKSFINIWVLIAMLVISLVGFFYFAFAYRTSVGGYLSYGQAYKWCIIVTLIWVPIMVFSKYGFTLIDPVFFDKVDVLTVENQIEMAQSFGAPESALQEAAVRGEEQVAEARTLVGQFKGMASLYIGFGLANLLFALFIRKNRPEFA